MNQEDKSKLVPVLLTTSVMVYIDGDPNDFGGEADSQLTVHSETLRKAVEAAFSDLPSEPIGAVAYHYPGQEDVNIHRCAECGTWITDPDKPDVLDGLMFGHEFEERLLCFEHYLIATGEYPACCCCVAEAEPPVPNSDQE